MARTAEPLVRWAGRILKPGVQSVYSHVTLLLAEVTTAVTLERYEVREYRDDPGKIGDDAFRAAVDHVDQETQRKTRFELQLWRVGEEEPETAKPFWVEYDGGGGSIADDPSAEGQISMAQRHTENLAKQYIAGMQSAMEQQRRITEQVCTLLAAYHAREQRLTERETAIAQVVAETAAEADGRTVKDEAIAEGVRMLSTWFTQGGGEALLKALPTGGKKKPKKLPPKTEPEAKS